MTLSHKARILYVDDDKENLNNFKAIFRRDYEIFLAASAGEGLEIMRNNDIQVLITDQRMPEITGSELLEIVADQFPETRRFILTAFSDFPPLVEAINRGRLQGYFSKPIDKDFIQSRIDEGLKSYYLERENSVLINKIGESERFLNAIVENIPDMIFVKDAKELRYVRLNKAGEELIGDSRDKLIGKSDHEFFPPEQADFYVQKDREALEKGHLIDISEEDIDTRKKGLRTIHTKKIPIHDANGTPVYLLGVSRDITEQKEMEQKERILVDKLNQIQKMESIGTLAGGIAHDFNNILSSIIGYTELAMMDKGRGKIPENCLKEIYTAGKRARDLVKQILTFARKSEEKVNPVQVDIIAKEALKLLRSSIPTTISIHQNIEPDVFIMANPTQVHQIFMNLCTNAAHSMDDKGGTLDVTVAKTQVSEKESVENDGIPPGMYLQIIVSDTGSGIPQDMLEKIFEPYFTTKGPSEGTGLGLSLVHGIVKSCGGKISVESRLGKGSVFTILMPLILQEAEPDSEDEIAQPSGNERILFVDDEETITVMMDEVLKRLGYTVTSVSSSQKAYNLFKKNPQAFDLVITDMTMPDITGDILASRLIKIRNDIPVILFTGYSRKISEEKAKQIGISAFLYKPVVIGDMAKTIRTVLDEHAMRSQPA